MEELQVQYREQPLVQFFTKNFDDLDFLPNQFDSVIGIDSLYFSNDLVGLLKQLKRSVKKGGKMGFLLNQHKANKNAPELLTGHKMNMTMACRKAGMSCTSICLTDHLIRLWDKMEYLLPQYAEAIIQENKSSSYLSRQYEVIQVSKLLKEHLSLIHISEPTRPY